MNFSINPISRSTEEKRQKFGIGSLFFLIVLGGIFVAGGIVGINKTKIDPSWQKISGTIATSVTTYDNEGQALYAPVVQYEVNGKDYKVNSSISSSSQPHNGEAREVAYNPTRPEDAKVVNNTGDTLFLYLFPAVGGFIMLLAPVLYIRSPRKENAEPEGQPQPAAPDPSHLSQTQSIAPVTPSPPQPPAPPTSLPN